MSLDPHKSPHPLIPVSDRAAHSCGRMPPPPLSRPPPPYSRLLENNFTVAATAVVQCCSIKWVHTIRMNPVILKKQKNNKSCIFYGWCTVLSFAEEIKLQVSTQCHSTNIIVMHWCLLCFTLWEIFWFKKKQLLLDEIKH